MHLQFLHNQHFAFASEGNHQVCKVISTARASAAVNNSRSQPLGMYSLPMACARAHTHARPRMHLTEVHILFAAGRSNHRTETKEEQQTAGKGSTGPEDRKTAAAAVSGRDSRGEHPEPLYVAGAES